MKEFFKRTRKYKPFCGKGLSDFLCDFFKAFINNRSFNARKQFAAVIHPPGFQKQMKEHSVKYWKTMLPTTGHLLKLDPVHSCLECMTFREKNSEQYCSSFSASFRCSRFFYISCYCSLRSQACFGAALHVSRHKRSNKHFISINLSPYFLKKKFYLTFSNTRVFFFF